MTRGEAIEELTAHGRRDRGGPIAIVDIGSNSVRLAIYESCSRAPAAVHNEKAICAIGRNMVSSGRLDEDGMRAALEALARYRRIAEAHRIKAHEAVATAAARDAPNGGAFVRRAEAVWGAPIRILSGEEEAYIAAEGVLAGNPGACGLAADLGGGSLDIAQVRDGKTGEAMTLPFGPLRLADLSEGDPRKARGIVDRGLAEIGDFDRSACRTLYAVGGVWRSFARVDMDETDYPLHVLHGYEIPKDRALRLARIIAQQSRKSLDRMRAVPRRRAEALPYGAVVLERLLLAADFDRVTISAYGLREGLLQLRLPPDERAKDPLIEFAAATNRRVSRVPAHAGELLDWMSSLFPDDDTESQRVREAVCLFSDIGWRRHPDDRAAGAFDEVATATFAGASHRTRILIAAAVFHRYSGDEEVPRGFGLRGLLNEAGSACALRLGLAARLGFALSASAAGELPHYPLTLDSGCVLLGIRRGREAVAGEPVRKRLSALAKAFGRKGEILFG